MLTENNNQPEIEAVNAFHPATESDIPKTNEDDIRPTQTRIRMRVPKEYHQEPVISRLISQYGLTVNVNAALLGVNSSDDGWFDLELHGSASQIASALIYLNDLDVEIWSNSTEPDQETW
ncbi:ABC transporter [Oscillatoriales cyanobacterium USR001]|nr:ABC transporter [Oscillatoriales cyanobacterium USR001]